MTDVYVHIYIYITHMKSIKAMDNPPFLEGLPIGLFSMFDCQRVYCHAVSFCIFKHMHSGGLLLVNISPFLLVWGCFIPPKSWQAIPRANTLPEKPTMSHADVYIASRLHSLPAWIHSYDYLLAIHGYDYAPNLAEGWSFVGARYRRPKPSPSRLVCGRVHGVRPALGSLASRRPLGVSLWNSRCAKKQWVCMHVSTNQIYTYTSIYTHVSIYPCVCVFMNIQI